MRTLCFRFSCISIALLLGSLITSGTARGQVFGRPMNGSQSGRFIDAPRGIQQQLREAERALAEERFSDAVVRLGDLLSAAADQGDDDDLAGQDFFLEIDDTRPSGTPVSNSMLRTARMMIGLLPSDALETYQLRYGPLARKLLTEAGETRDWHKVRDVRRMYFHTEAGYEASVLLAQHEMFAGHALAASLLLDDVVSVPRATQHLGPGAAVLHAAAMSLAGRDLKTSELGESEIVVRGERVAMPKADELPQWLSERIGTMKNFVPAPPTEFPMQGGRPDRNGVSAGQFPLTNVRWKLDTTASPTQKRTVRQTGDELTTSGKLPPPSWTPLRVGDQLLMRTTERLVGVDYRTGKRVWTYPWQAAYEGFPDEDSAIDSFGSELSDPSELISQRVWNDLPYGQITSDGDRVFMLDDLGEVEAATFGTGINLGGSRPADTRTNTLVALDLATEGKLLWRLGAGADDDPKFSDAFFLGPPLPLDGRLYVMVEVAGDISLACLHPATGEELWRQQLVAVESGGIHRDPIRRVAGAVPTYHEGILLCPTGAGAMLAIDLADRMLRWGISYERNREMLSSITRGGRGLETSQLMQRWHTGVAVAHEDAVLVTPIETDRLFGFSLLTGDSLFDEKNRVNSRYLAGIRDGSFYVAGSNHLRAFNLSDGSLRWTTPSDMLSAGQQIAGQGVFGKDNYLVPTTSNQIIRVSLKDGSVLDRRNTRFALGNLVAADGEIIAQGSSEISVAFGEATLEPIVDRMLSKNPDDFEAIVRKSELLIQRGERDAALEMLGKARKMEPDNDEVRMLSVTAMLGTLRENLMVDEDVIKTLDQLIDQPAQRVELLSLRIRAALTSQSYVEAANQLIDLSELVVSEPLLESSSTQVVNDTSRHCKLDAWVAARVQDIVEKAPEADLATVNSAIAIMSETHLKGSSNLIRRIVNHFGALDGVSTLRKELLERYRKEGNHLQLERLALGTELPTTDGLASLSDQRLESLTEAYVDGGLAEDALTVLRTIKSRMENDEEADETRYTQLLQLATQKRRTEVWPEHAALQWSPSPTRIRFTTKQRVSGTTVLAGKSFQGWRLISENTSPLGFRDPYGLNRRIPMEGNGQIDASDKEAMVCGGVMVVMMPSGLVCIDLYHLLAGDGEAVLWRRGLSGESSPTARRGTTMTPFDDQVYYYSIAGNRASNPIPEFKLGPILGDRVLVLQGGDLIALDLFTNETIWRNSTAPRSGSVLCDGERVAVISSATKEVVLFNLLDGRKIETRKWEHGNIWEAIGSHVLSYQPQQEGKNEVRLVNPFTEELVLKHECYGVNRSGKNAPSTYGRVVDGRYMALLNSDGQATIWDIKEGTQVCQPKLPEYADLQGLRAMLLDGQLLLLPKRRIVRSKQPPGQQLQTTDGDSHRTVHGVHAISVEDGKVRWSKHFETPWGCTLTQPFKTPMLLLTRSPFTYSVQSRKKFLDVLALDLRDGSELSRREGKPILSQNNELEAKLTIQPTQPRVIAQVGPEMLTYTFSDVAPKKEKQEPTPE
ncbi:MAG: PQQ-binding-like beta-propeller repeat protein [Rubripirellula sp.]